MSQNNTSIHSDKNIMFFQITFSNKIISMNHIINIEFKNEISAYGKKYPHV